MAAQRAAFSWWRSLPCGASAAAGTLVASRRFTLTEDNANQYPDASDLQEHHISNFPNQSWFVARPGLRKSGRVNETEVNKYLNPLKTQFADKNFPGHDELVVGRIVEGSTELGCGVSSGCARANATEKIFWEPKEVKAAVVTCGGLCPGLNSIIREVTNCLWHQYGVQEIWGFTSGYKGLSDPEKYPPMRLTNDIVRGIHLEGGSIIKADRGGLDPSKIVDNLQKRGINMLFVVGGDGTQWAGDVVFQEAKNRGYKLSIVGVPKSIDNDVLFIDRTFGFDSAVKTGADVIRNAWVEATSCHKGVGIVKLMGRDAGWVAMHASLASNLVDACLIPEVPWSIPDLMTHVDKTLARKGHMVIVVAEGAGQEHVATGKVDATGHTVYGDIGLFLKKTVNDHLKDKGGRSFYIDPSYIVRSVPAMPNDHIYCLRLSHDAVHVAMRGYSGVCVGSVNGYVSIIPSKLIAMGKKTGLSQQYPVDDLCGGHQNAQHTCWLWRCKQTNDTKTARITRDVQKMICLTS